MIEVAVIIALLALLGWEKYQNRLERNKFLNALLSKNANEMANLDMADKTKIEVKPTEPLAVPPDLIPESDLPDEEFDKFVTNQNG